MRIWIIGGTLLMLTLWMPAAAQAEVSCVARNFLINGYIYGMPALENVQLEGGASMANVSLCGQKCEDPATAQRLAIALTAQARGAALELYFGNVDSCAAVSAHDKSFGLRLLP